MRPARLRWRIRMPPPSDAVQIDAAWPLVGDEAPNRPSPAREPGIGHQLHAVARLIRRRFERNVRQAGLPITRLQAALLIYIARHPGVGPTAAASDLDIEPIALVQM